MATNKWLSDNGMGYETEEEALTADSIHYNVRYRQIVDDMTSIDRLTLDATHWKQAFEAAKALTEKRSKERLMLDKIETKAEAVAAAEPVPEPTPAAVPVVTPVMVSAVVPVVEELNREQS
jgi:hypothetical protein